MTTQEIIDYYTNLLIIQYNNKPKAIAHIDTLVSPVVMDQLPVDVQDAFNIDNAVGVQLDTLGKYAGVSRTGVDNSGSITLGDADYRQLIKFAIIKNNGGSSLSDIINLIQIFFPGGGFRVYDYSNMRMSYLIDNSIGSLDLARMIVINKLLPKPMGVEDGSLIFDANINNFFGMRNYLFVNPNIRPFNSYTSYNPTWVWASYSMAV